MAIVVFDPSEFRDINPQFNPRLGFAGFTDAQLQFAFEVACLVVNNSEHSIVPYNPPTVNTRKIILYLLVCHLCELKIRGGGIVGTMTNATEGSVSAGFSAPMNPNAAWFNQSQCGALAWQLLLPYALGGRLYNGCFR